MPKFAQLVVETDFETGFLTNSPLCPTRERSNQWNPRDVIEQAAYNDLSWQEDALGPEETT